MNKDEIFMEKVLRLATRGAGAVSPNPMVGAIFVKNGKVLAEGWHQKFGGPHAEIRAIANARGKNLAGSTLYVNLEPCCHLNKKTPPCINALLKTKIKRAVVATKDPNPDVNGRGIGILKKNGIKVDVGCLKNSAHALNEKFFKWISTGIPFVGMKVAMSLDGKIATRTGDSKWITSAQSRNLVKKLRDSYDAILIGANTVMEDNPTLSGNKRQPLRILLDSTLRVNPKMEFLRDKNILLVTTDRARESRIDFFKNNGYPIKIFHKKITIAPLLRFLGRKGISSVFVEGGSAVFGSFVDARAVDKFHWFIAPKIIGGRDAKNAVAGIGIDRLKKAITLKKTSVKSSNDIYLEGSLN